MRISDLQIYTLFSVLRVPAPCRGGVLSYRDRDSPNWIHHLVVTTPDCARYLPIWNRTGSVETCLESLLWTTDRRLRPFTIEKPLFTAGGQDTSELGTDWALRASERRAALAGGRGHVERVARSGSRGLCVMRAQHALCAPHWRRARVAGVRRGGRSRFYAHRSSTHSGSIHERRGRSRRLLCQGSCYR